MSFRERTAWIGLAIMLVVWGWYFNAVWGVLAGGGAESWPTDLFVRCVIVTIAASIGLSLLASIFDPETLQSVEDEREVGIEARGSTVAYNLLCGLIAVGGVAGTLYLGTPTRDGVLIMNTRVDSQVLMANGIVLALVIAEIVRLAVVVRLHRRGG